MKSMTEENLTDTKPHPTCIQWMRSEVLCRRCTVDAATWFGEVDKANQRIIDLKASFCLEASFRVLVIKFLLLGLVAASYVYLWVDYEYPHWFMAYLSYWTMFYAVVYLGMSFLMSFVSFETSRYFLKFTWVMYLVAAVHGIMVVILFWVTEYDPSAMPLKFSTVAAHGVSFALVEVDGILVNKVPVRLTHVVFVFLLGCLYVGWTLIQGLIPIDNPNKDEDDEALYSILDWEEKPLSSAIVTVIVLFVTFPLFTLLFWGLSLWGRRYVDEEVAEVTDMDGKVGTVGIIANNDQEKSPSSSEELESVEMLETAIKERQDTSINQDSEK